MGLLSIFVVIASLIIYSDQQVEERIILIPDADGKVGQIFVSNSSSSHTVSQAYMSIEVKDKSTISSPKQLDKENVTDDFSGALSSVPLSQSKYILYFISGTTELTERSKKLINKIVSDVKSREIYDVFIDGHTDTTGSSEKNYQLALERAITVRALFGEKIPQPENVRVTSHGDGNLLIKTADEVNEPRNRRVEILIH